MMSEPASSKTKVSTPVSRARYNSPKYMIREDKLKYVRPIIIVNWKACIDENDEVKPDNNRLKTHAERVKETLKWKFGASVQVLELPNKSKNDLMNELKNEAKTIPLAGKQRPDIFLCFIIARGTENFFYEVRDPRNMDISEKIYIRDIVHLLNGENCPGLIFRPKLFFVQTECEVKPEKIGLFTEDEPSPPPASPETKTLPVEADFLMYSSTSPDTDDHPSHFMDCLCEGLLKDQEILDITLGVNLKVHEKSKKIPLCTSQLTKQLVLKPTTNTA